MRLATGIVLLVGGTLAAAAAPGADSPEQTVADLHAALATGNRAGVLAALAPDVVVFESGEAELSRDEYASHHLAADLEFAGATKETVLSRTSAVSGDAAWVLTRGERSGSFRGREVATLETETALLRRVAGRWLIAHLHWSSQGKKR